MADSGVAHRDVKSDNIIVNPDTLAIKIIDFGLATLNASSLSAEDNQPIGTPVYMAPAVLTCESKKMYKLIASDLWSTGIVFWECLLGKHPFANVANKKELVGEQLKRHDFNGYSPSAQHLLEGLLTVDEDARMTAADARSFIRSIGKDRRSSGDLVGSHGEGRPPRSHSYCITRRKSSGDLNVVLTC